MTNSVDINQNAPPLYGEHVLDQLYADLDMSGMMTPAPQSGMSTPFLSQSRRGSTENLRSLDSVANGAVPPHALTNRLQNLAASSRNSSFLRRSQLNGSGSNTPRYQDDHHDGPSSLPHQNAGYFDQHDSHHSSHPSSAPRSNPLSRRTSEEEQHGLSGFTSGAHTPEHIDFTPEMGSLRPTPGLETLSKVPSYGTAIKTPARGMSHTDLRSLPNYEQAISRPASPIRTPSLSTSTPGPSGRMGYFDGAMSPEMSITVGNGRTLDNDAGRRLHLMQARGRAH